MVPGPWLRSQAQMPIFVHTLGNQGEVAVHVFPLPEAHCPLREVRGPASAWALCTSLPPQLPHARTVTIHRAGDQGSRERGSPFCDFPLVSAPYSCPVLNQSVCLSLSSSIHTDTNTHAHMPPGESGIQHPRDPQAISDGRGRGKAAPLGSLNFFPGQQSNTESMCKASG